MTTKLIIATLLTAIPLGCADPKIAMRDEGRGTKQIYHDPYSKVWKAAILAYTANNIPIRESSEEKGVIIGVKTARMESWGENVITWVRRKETNTVEVEVLSKLRGTAWGDFYNWEKPVHNQIQIILLTAGDKL